MSRWHSTTLSVWLVKELRRKGYYCPGNPEDYFLVKYRPSSQDRASGAWVWELNKPRESVEEKQKGTFYRVVGSKYALTELKETDFNIVVADGEDTELVPCGLGPSKSSVQPVPL